MATVVQACRKKQLLKLDSELNSQCRSRRTASAKKPAVIALSSDYVLAKDDALERMYCVKDCGVVKRMQQIKKAKLFVKQVLHFSVDALLLTLKC